MIGSRPPAPDHHSTGDHRQSRFAGGLAVAVVFVRTWMAGLGRDLSGLCWPWSGVAGLCSAVSWSGVAGGLYGRRLTPQAALNLAREGHRRGSGRLTREPPPSWAGALTGGLAPAPPAHRQHRTTACRPLAAPGTPPCSGPSLASPTLPDQGVPTSTGESHFALGSPRFPIRESLVPGPRARLLNCRFGPESRAWVPTAVSGGQLPNPRPGEVAGHLRPTCRRSGRGG